MSRLGTPVRLVMTSQDVIHSFFVPAFRIKQDVLPGRYTETWFTRDKTGVFHLFCAEYCGTDHSRMTRPDRRDAAGRLCPLARGAAGKATTWRSEGAALFRSLGCSGCHAAASTVHAPDLDGVLWAQVQLADGRTVTADEAYLRDSILLPRQDVVAGLSSRSCRASGES